MDIQTISTIIGSLGFPIVCCIGMFYFLIKTAQQHKEEIDKLSEAVNNNTNVISQLIARIDRDN